MLPISLLVLEVSDRARHEQHEHDVRPVRRADPERTRRSPSCRTFWTSGSSSTPVKAPDHSALAAVERDAADHGGGEDVKMLPGVAPWFAVTALPGQRSSGRPPREHRRANTQQPIRSCRP